MNKFEVVKWSVEESPDCFLARLPKLGLLGLTAYANTEEEAVKKLKEMASYYIDFAYKKWKEVRNE